MSHDHDSHGDSHGDHAGIGHVAPLKALLGTGTALLILTWFTVFIAKVDLGEFNIWMALAVAVVKGTLVALFFMHLRWDRPFNSIIFVGSLALVMLFVGLAITDTSEYQRDIIPGDATDVTSAIAEFTSEAEAVRAAGGGGGSGDAH